MSYQGDIVPGQTLNFKFTTVTASGLPTIFTGSPALVAYKDSSTASTTAGITLTANFGGITGSNHVNVSTGADGTFYAAGSDFMVVVSAGTVGGVSIIGYDVGEFSISNRSALRPAVAGRTIAVTATGAAGVDWGNVENKTTVNNLSSTNISTSQNVNTVATVTALSAGANNAIADAWTARNVAGGSSAGRTNGEALFFLRNKWEITASILTVYGTDDSTPAWTASVGTNAAAIPIVSNDPS